MVLQSATIIVVLVVVLGAACSMEACIMVCAAIPQGDGMMVSAPAA
jgi:hypothetical protein